MAGFSPGPRTRSLVWNKTQGRCWYCGVRMDPFVQSAPNSATIDHFIPQKDGASNKNSITNLVPACFNCNQLKAHDTLVQFRATMKAVHCSNTYVFYFEKKKLIIGPQLYLNN